MKTFLREWGLLMLASTLILIWTSIPNWVGESLEDQRYSYTGTFFDAPDYAVHIAMLRSGMQGNWAYSLRFTTEPHKAEYFRMFYIALGQLNRLLQLDPESLYHLARWIFGFTALLALFRLIKRIFTSRRSQWIAFFLVVLGSGLGYLQLISGIGLAQISPVDTWLIDAYVFFSLAIFPHFAFTLTWMLVGLSGCIDFMNSGGWGRIGVCILAAWLVQAVNPIAFLLVDVFIAGLALFTWWQAERVDWRQAGALLILALAQLPLLVYNYLALKYDPVWSLFTAQNLTPSPPPIHYFWGFGLFWLLGLMGAVRAARERNRLLLAFALWLIAAFALAYAPMAIQRRFLLGITIPFGLLSTYALEWIQAHSVRAPRWLRSRFPVIAILLLLCMCMTSILLAPAYALFLQARPAAYFYPRSMDAAFAWIDQNTRPDDFIFEGDARSGLLIAQKTGRRVFLGHTMETISFSDKQAIVQEYYRNKLASGWMQATPMRWVFYGPYEYELAPNFVPPANLAPAWENEGVRIYRVR